MVTDEKLVSTALTRYRLGTIFIWLGVMTWLPFIVLRIAGEKPSFFWYLPVHLFGVVGGSRLRSAALKEMDSPAPKKNPLGAVGHGLIYIGVLVWAPYFYLIDKSVKHRTNGGEAIVIQKGVFEGTRIQFIQEAIS
jgi:hypothetical protein